MSILTTRALHHQFIKKDNVLKRMSFGAQA